jgi:hypothetical protein
MNADLRERFLGPSWVDTAINTVVAVTVLVGVMTFGLHSLIQYSLKNGAAHMGHQVGGVFNGTALGVNFEAKSSKLAVNVDGPKRVTTTHIRPMAEEDDQGGHVLVTKVDSVRWSAFADVIDMHDKKNGGRAIAQGK